MKGEPSRKDNYFPGSKGRSKFNVESDEKLNFHLDVRIFLSCIF